MGADYPLCFRSEAKNVPRLLVAAKETGNSTDTDSSGGGFWVDDAYIATSTTEAVRIEDSAPDAQDEYYKSLLLRYDLLRATLKCTPPVEAINALPASRPISYPRDSKKARNTWRRLISMTEPRLAQLACMDSESVLGLIGLIVDALPKVLKRGDKIQVKHIGAWIWGCLGRCWEVERLGSEEVAELRQLGKAAVACLVEVRDGLDVSAVYQRDDRGAGEDLDYGDDEPLNNGTFEESFPSDTVHDNSETTGTVESEAEKLAHAKQQLQSSLLAGESGSEESGEIVEEPTDDTTFELNTQTRAVLDMIITIVGVKYGQRDLLEFRDIWEEDGPG